MESASSLTRRAVLGTGVAALSMIPLSANATPADTATAIAKTLKSVTPKDGRITITLPQIAENGGTVPLSLSVDSPMTEQDHVTAVHIFCDGNPLPEMATYRFGAHNGKADLSLRIRLSKTQNVIVVAEMNNGEAFINRQEIKVTLGGCGG